jgi:probable phosphoglycerate mutase
VTGRRLILLRHGQTSWNLSGHAQGHADIGLDDRGHQQAAAVAPDLADLEPVALWTSDLVRARQTCGYLEECTGLSAKQDDRLREFDVGAREGLNVAEFAERFPEAHAAWARGEDALLPGAETAADVHRRIVPALQECLASLAPGELGIVVTHGASLRVGLCGLLGWPLKQEASLRGLDNCRWATVAEREAGGRLRMVGYNESVTG